MRFVDSTLGAFLIENLCIIAIVAFRRLFRLHDLGGIRFERPTLSPFSFLPKFIRQ